MGRVADVLRASGRKPEKLAKQIGISVERVNAFLLGAEPTMAELSALARALHLNLVDFVPPEESHAKALLLFRRGWAKNRPEAELESDRLSTKLNRLLELISRSAPDPLAWRKEFGEGHVSAADADRDAVVFRKLFFRGDFVSPMYDLPSVLSSLGIVVTIIEGERVEGASAVMGGRVFIFLSPRFLPRMLFTLAHEIGHLIAHSEESEFAVIDEELNWKTRNAREQFANAFASSLLLPKGGVGTALQTFRKMYEVKRDEFVGDIEILFLARVFGVSFQVAAHRCEALDLVPRGTAFSLHEKLTNDYESPEKRADDAGLPPRPKLEFPAAPGSLMEEAVESIRNGKVSIGRAAATLGMSVSALVAANRSSGIQ